MMKCICLLFMMFGCHVSGLQEDNFLLVTLKGSRVMYQFDMDDINIKYQIIVDYRVRHVLYNYDEKCLMWTTDERFNKKIMGMYLNGTKFLFYKADTTPKYIAYEPSSKVLYYTAKNGYTGYPDLLIALNQEGTTSILLNKGSKKDFLVLDPSKGYLFYTCYDETIENKGVYRVDMNGQNLIHIVNYTQINDVVGIYVDPEAEVLYVTSTTEDRIYKCDYNGDVCDLFYTNYGVEMYHIQISNQFLYFTSRGGDSARYLYKCPLGSTNCSYTNMGYTSSSSHTRYLDSYKREDNVTKHELCSINNGGCKDFCFPTPTNYTCNVPMCPEAIEGGIAYSSGGCNRLAFDVCRFYCNRNYAQKRGVKYLTCTSQSAPGDPTHLLWDLPEPVCTAKPCQYLAVPNGTFDRICDRHRGTNCTDFTCNSEFSKNPEVIPLVCQQNFTWNHPMDTLCLPMCPVLNNGPTLNHTCTREYSQTCSYNCPISYIVMYSGIRCESGGQWNVSSDKLCIAMCPVLGNDVILHTTCTRHRWETCSYLCPIGYAEIHDEILCGLDSSGLDSQWNVSTNNLCSDIDECALETDACDINAGCANIEASYTCTCNAGYIGDGLTCSDIDECGMGSDTCHTEAVCANTLGSYTCTCKTEYSGDGFTCLPMCPVLGNGVILHTTCTRHLSETCSYLCPIGYAEIHDEILCGLDSQWNVSTNNLCSDIDECALETDACDINAGCANIEASYTCTCNAGYIGDGLTCSDIDECEMGSDTCHTEAVCANTLGSYTCTCKTEYSGDGFTCLSLCPVLNNGPTLHHTCTREYSQTCSYNCPIGYTVMYAEILCGSGGQWNVSSDKLCIGCIHSQEPLQPFFSQTVPVLLDGRIKVDCEKCKGYENVTYEWILADIANYTTAHADCLKYERVFVSSETGNSADFSCSSTNCSRLLNGTTDRKLTLGLKVLAQNKLVNSDKAISSVNTEVFVRHLPVVEKDLLCSLNPEVDGDVQTEYHLNCTSLHKKYGIYGDTLDFYTNNPRKFQKKVAVKSDKEVVLIDEFIEPVSKMFSLPVGDPVIVNVLVFQEEALIMSQTFKLQIQALDVKNISVEEFENNLANVSVTNTISMVYSMASSIREAEIINKTDEKYDDMRLKMLSKLTELNTTNSLREVTSATTVFNIITEKQDWIDTISKKSSVVGLYHQLSKAFGDLEEDIKVDELTNMTSIVVKGVSNILDQFIEEHDHGNTSVAYAAEMANMSHYLMDSLDDAFDASLSNLDQTETPLLLYESTSTACLVQKRNKSTVGKTKLVVESHNEEDGETVFKFPDMFDSDDANEIGIQMVYHKKNPYIWDEPTVKVTEPVLTVTLKDHNKQEMEVSQLREPVKYQTQRISNVTGTSHINISYTTEGDTFNLKEGSEMLLIGFTIETGETKLMDIILPENISNVWIFGQPLTPPDYTTVVRRGFSYPQQWRQIQAFYGFKDALDLLENNTSSYELYIPPDDRYFGLNESFYEMYFGITLKVDDENVISELKELDTICRNASSQTWEEEKCNGSIQLKFEIQLDGLSCVFWEEASSDWSTKGCEAHPGTDAKQLECWCYHLSSFSAKFRVGDFHANSALLFFEPLFLFQTLLDNPVIVTVVYIVWMMYLLLVFWARMLDQRDVEQTGVLTCEENGPSETYLYLVCVVTGWWLQAGTTANVYINITGVNGSSFKKRLSTTARQCFQSGHDDWFLFSTEKSLGSLESVTIWHDNSGTSPHWYLTQVSVKDLQSRRLCNFIFDDWLAVDRGRLQQTSCTLKAVTEGEMDAKQKYNFTVTVSRYLRDFHPWVSIWWKPPWSTFTRVQRLTCVLTLVLTMMLSNIILHGLPSDNPDEQIQPRTFSFSSRQLIIGIVSSTIVFPVNLIILQLFVQIKPKQSKITENHMGKVRMESVHVERRRLNRKSETKSSTVVLDFDELKRQLKKEQRTKVKINSLNSPGKMEVSEEMVEINIPCDFEQDSVYETQKSKMNMGKQDSVYETQKSKMNMGKQDSVYETQKSKMNMGKQDSVYETQKSKMNMGKQDSVYETQKSKMNMGKQDSVYETQKSKMNMGKQDSVYETQKSKMNMGKQDSVYETQKSKMNMGKQDSVYETQKSKMNMGKQDSVYKTQKSKMKMGKQDSVCETQKSKMKMGKQDSVCETQKSKMNMGKQDSVYESQKSKMNTGKQDSVCETQKSKMKMGKQDSVYETQKSKMNMGKQDSVYETQKSKMNMGKQDSVCETQKSKMKMGKQNSVCETQKSKMNMGKQDSAYETQKSKMKMGKQDSAYETQKSKMKMGKQDSVCETQKSKMNMGKQDSAYETQKSKMKMGKQDSAYETQKSKMNMGKQDSAYETQKSKMNMGKEDSAYETQKSKMKMGKQDSAYETQKSKMKMGKQDSVYETQKSKMNMGKEDSAYETQKSKMKMGKQDSVCETQKSKMKMGKQDSVYKTQKSKMNTGKQESIEVGQLYAEQQRKYLIEHSYAEHLSKNDIDKNSDLERVPLLHDEQHSGFYNTLYKSGKFEKSPMFQDICTKYRHKSGDKKVAEYIRTCSQNILWSALKGGEREQSQKNVTKDLSQSESVHQVPDSISESSTIARPSDGLSESSSTLIIDLVEAKRMRNLSAMNQNNSNTKGNISYKSWTIPTRDLNTSARNRKCSTKNSLETFRSNQPSVDVKYQNSAEEVHEGSPWWFIYIVWSVVTVTCLVSSFIVVLYGLRYGHTQSMEWTVSFFTSCLHNVFVEQPLKVIILAAVLTLILRKPVKLWDYGPDAKLGQDEVYVGAVKINTNKHQPTVVPMDPVKIERTHRKLMNAWLQKTAVQEMVLYILYLTVLLFVVHGHNNHQVSYMNSQTVYTGLVKPCDGPSFLNVTCPDDFYAYMLQTFSPKAKSLSIAQHDENSFTANHYMLGLYRIRQVRSKTVECAPSKYHNSTQSQCIGEYHYGEEDQARYGDSWSNVPVETSTGPWSYQELGDLQTWPFFGTHATYPGGGGYVLLVEPNDAGNISQLKEKGWIDRQTRAVFVECTVYNPNMDMFTMVVLLLEATPIGNMHPSYEISSRNLHHYSTHFQKVVGVCEGLFVCLNILFIYIEYQKLNWVGKREYFSDLWNFLEMLQITISLIVIGFFIKRFLTISSTLTKLSENFENKYINLYDTFYWNSVFEYIMAFLVTIVVIKSIKMSRFHSNTRLLNATLRRVGPEIAHFLVIFIIIIIAYAHCGVLMFGRILGMYRDIQHSLYTNTHTLLGLDIGLDMKGASSLFGPVYLMSFLLIVSIVSMKLCVTIITTGYIITKFEQDTAGEFKIVDYIMAKIGKIIAWK